MTVNRRLSAFRRRWNIQVESPEEWKRFTNRVITQIGSVLSSPVFVSASLQGLEERFCFLMGKPFHNLDLLSMDFLGARNEFAKTEICRSIANAGTETHVIEAIQVLFWALKDIAPNQVREITSVIIESIEHSPNIDVRLSRRGTTVTLFRAGASTLDKGIVEETLEWLEEHPEVAKHFEEALRICLARDQEKYRNLLDNLRFAIEQLLRSVLNNRKTLENQKEALLRWLEQHGVHKQIINMYQTLLSQFSQYQNDAVKHAESYSPSEIEFMIYLSGTFMRLLLQINNQTQ